MNEICIDWILSGTKFYEFRTVHYPAIVLSLIGTAALRFLQYQPETKIKEIKEILSTVTMFKLVWLFHSVIHDEQFSPQGTKL